MDVCFLLLKKAHISGLHFMFEDQFGRNFETGLQTWQHIPTAAV